jgi:hypothetical protein
LPFYLDPPTKELRFGDVVTGFQHPTVRVDTPDNTLDLTISVTRPQYFAVMTPCCAIELNSVSLAPLVQVRNAIVLKHPRLHDNLSLINVPFPPKEGLTEEQISKMDTDKQAEVLSEAAKYTYLDCFVYEQNGFFPAYEVKRNSQTLATLQCRMVDFKSIFRVECSLIAREQDAPTGIKVSELTMTTRARLRDKLTYYFSRNGDEEQE